MKRRIKIFGADSLSSDERDMLAALEAADALADELEWATRQIAPHKIMCMADDGPACTCDRPQRIKQAIQALAAYRSATKG